MVLVSFGLDRKETIYNKKGKKDQDWREEISSDAVKDFFLLD
jgi:hypothetical protein